MTVPVQEPVESGWWKSHHGTIPQWITAIVAVILALAGWSRYSHQQSAEDFSRQVKDIVRTELQPLTDKVGGLAERISNLEGWKEHADKKVKSLENQQGEVFKKVSTLQEQQTKYADAQKKITENIEQVASLERLQDPRRILATIRYEIESATEQKRILPASDVADYKSALHAVPASLTDYWTTAAAIVNYQSLLNQMSGAAPDPAKVAQQCVTYQNSEMLNTRLSNCVIELDSNIFGNVVFTNSVVIYKGGPVQLYNVTFDNCRFVLEFPPNTTTPQVKLLFALLNSPDQKVVKVPR